VTWIWLVAGLLLSPYLGVKAAERMSKPLATYIRREGGGDRA
jgi:hypothetical protein